MIITPELTLENIRDLLNEYDKVLDDSAGDLSLQKKEIGTANRDQVSLQCFYDEKRAEIDSISKFIELELLRIKGELWKKLTISCNIDLSIKDKEQFINCELEYIQMKQLFIAVMEIVQKFEGVCGSFKQRGYSLKNLTELKLHALEDSII